MSKMEKKASEDAIHVVSPKEVFAPLSSAHVVQGEPRTLQLRENTFSLSGDSFKATDPMTGQLVFEIKGKTLSLSDRKEMLDAATGHPVGIAKGKHMTMHKRQMIMTPKEQQVASVKTKHMMQLHANAEVEINGQIVLNVEGSIRSKKFAVMTAHHELIAVSRRKGGINMHNMLADKDCYFLTVAPGVDMAFMVLLCVCLDEIFRDKPNN